VLITQHLNLDVARGCDGLFDVHGAVAERFFGLAARALQGLGELGLAVDAPHAFTTAARARLEQHRVAHCGRRRFGFVQRRGGAAWYDGHAGVLHPLPGARLVTHFVDGARGRSDEHHAGSLASATQLRALGQESIAGVNPPGTDRARSIDDALGVEVRGAPLADAHRGVGAANVERVLVGVGVDRHRG
jgi:hypothetical protein